LVEDSIRWRAFHAEKKDLPAYLRKKDSIYWHTHLPGQSTYYVQVNLMREGNNQSFKDLSSEVIQAVERHRPTKLILDMRWNIGGNSKLAYPLLYTLMYYERAVPGGQVFVITGRETLSAAIVVSDEIKKFTNAIFIGEPTGAAPNLYGENSYPLVLPNSGLSISYASAYFQAAGPFSHDRWIAPQISVKMRSQDFFGLQDPVLNTIRDYQPATSVWNSMYEAANRRDTVALVEIYHAYKSDPANEYIDTEADMRRLANRLATSDRANEAEILYLLNIAAYPRRATPHISLAQIYQQQDRMEPAGWHYRSAKKLLLLDNTINAYFKHNLTDLVDRELLKFGPMKK
ncbi:MAG: hypothetical protein ABI581_15525, partial [Sediminibacterium sp.]